MKPIGGRILPVRKYYSFQRLELVDGKPNSVPSTEPLMSIRRKEGLPAFSKLRGSLSFGCRNAAKSGVRWSLRGPQPRLKGGTIEFLIL